MSLLSPRSKSNEPAPPQLDLAVFGKHPGWDDHMEPLGLDTQGLIDFKWLLYENGVSGVIDQGGWEKLEGDNRAKDFGHTFLYLGAGHAIVGRMWASVDGKGRDRYPMVAALYGSAVPLTWMLSSGVAQLRKLEEVCKGTQSADTVRDVAKSTASALNRDLAEHPEANAIPCSARRMVGERLTKIGGEDALYRVLYALERERDACMELTKNAPIPAFSLRVPVEVATGQDQSSLMIWAGLLLERLENRVRALLVQKDDASWLDVLVGRIEADAFFCLQAAPGALPLTSEIPFELDEDELKALKAVLDANAPSDLDAFLLPKVKGGLLDGLKDKLGFFRKR